MTKTPCIRCAQAAIIAAGAVGFAGGAHAQSPADLSQLSLEELANVQVTSVSKRAEPLSQAASAVYVISHDDIARSGATTVPEMLRLAPNLQIARTSASRYVITARGFNGNTQAQSFSNKLLVLIDGRSVYTPLYSGVYWDMQDLPPQDIERIEVISGPGATLWGANAVNGVVNIITRAPSQTQGGVLDAGAGERQQHLGIRYGGRVTDDLSYRVYARALADEGGVTATGARAHDDWTRLQGGFRLDWTVGTAGVLTLQGDAYRGSEHQAGAGDENIGGRNLLARWSRTAPSGGQLQVQAYYDRTERATEGGGGKFALETYDLDLQDSFALGTRHQIVWGGGARTSRYRITGTPTFFFTPAQRTLNLVNVFAQDSISLNQRLRLTLGVKLEDDPYVDPVLLPNIRFAWTPSDSMMLWAAASRAVRAPTPFDRDVVEKLGPAAPPQLIGNAGFQHEKLAAYQVGARFQPSAAASISVSAFFNDYDQLRTIELSPGGRLPLLWGNLLQGSTYGLEAWGDYRVSPGWRLAGGVSTLQKDLKFKPGATRILGVKQAGDDPKYQASLKSSMDLGPNVTLDARLRYVSAAPDPRVPAYVELDARIGWNVAERVQVSLSARNLLHDRRLEFPGGDAVPRSVFADLQWRF